MQIPSLLLYILLLLLKPSQADSSELSVKALYRGFYNFPKESFYEHDSPYYYLIEIRVKNISIKKVEFLTENCTPISNIVLKSTDFKICSNNCYTNKTISVFLDPGQEFSIDIVLMSDQNKIGRCIEIGWAYLTKKNTKTSDNYVNSLYRAKTSFENVIWSNNICLDSSSGNAYIVK